jgi:hypothetical protein
MAFKAGRNYSSGKLCGPINVARAVDPSMPIAPITYWQLEETIAVPVEIRLPPLSGAGYEIDALSSLENILTPTTARCLEEPILSRLHHKLKSGLGGLCWVMDD